MTIMADPTSVPTPPENWEGLTRTCLLWYDGPMIELYTAEQGDGWFALLADVNPKGASRAEEIWIAAHLTAEQIAACRACEEVNIEQLFKESDCVREIHSIAVLNTADDHQPGPLWTYHWASSDVVNYEKADDSYKADPQAIVNFNV